MENKLASSNFYIGSRILLEALLQNNIDTVFGYPGGANLPLYDEMYIQSDIKHYLYAHEQAATHAAQGYYRATGKIAAVFLTSGPGATNGVTGITDALLDSTPMLIITSQVPSYVIGTDAFQEADVIGITKSITKHNYQVKDVNKLYNTLNEAIYIASTGRFGPVLVDIPKDVYTLKVENFEATKYIPRQSYNIKTDIEDEKIQQVVKLVIASKKPIFYCGGGINAICSDDNTIPIENLLQIVELTNFPITTTLMGLGVFNPEHKNSLQMLGMHGTYEANMAMHDCDLMLAIGVRFDDRVTGKLELFSPNSKKVHIDIDPSELNKNIKVDIAITGSCDVFLEKLLNELKKQQALINHENTKEWWSIINKWKEKDSYGFTQEPNGDILPHYVLDEAYKITKKYYPFFTTDVGQHQMWAAQYCKVSKQRRFITSAGLGTMGFGLPAAIGAQIAKPNDLIVCITSEGSFMMNMQELMTVKKYNLPVKILMLQNNYLGMVRQWQDLFYSGRLMEVDFEVSAPNFVMLCASFGIKAKVVDKVENVTAAIEEMVNYEGAYFLSVLTKRKMDVYPMIAPGKAHNEMIFE